MQRATQLIESTREPDLEPLLEGARCLAYLEMDMARTARLFDELGALLHPCRALVPVPVGPRAGASVARRHPAPPAPRSARPSTLPRHAVTTGRRSNAPLVSHCWNSKPATSPPPARLADQLAATRRQARRRQRTALRGGHLGARSHRSPRARRDGACLTARSAELEQIDARFLVPDLYGIAAELSPPGRRPRRSPRPRHSRRARRGRGGATIRGRPRPRAAGLHRRPTRRPRPLRGAPTGGRSMPPTACRLTWKDCDGKPSGSSPARRDDQGGDDTWP